MIPMTLPFAARCLSFSSITLFFLQTSCADYAAPIPRPSSSQESSVFTAGDGCDDELRGRDAYLLGGLSTDQVSAEQIRVLARRYRQVFVVDIGFDERSPISFVARDYFENIVVRAGYRNVQIVPQAAGEIGPRSDVDVFVVAPNPSWLSVSLGADLSSVVGSGSVGYVITELNPEALINSVSLRVTRLLLANAADILLRPRGVSEPVQAMSSFFTSGTRVNVICVEPKSNTVSLCRLIKISAPLPCDCFCLRDLRNSYPRRSCGVDLVTGWATQLVPLCVPEANPRLARNPAL